MIASLRAQPAGVGPIAALRRAAREVFASLSEQELGRELERQELARTVPELRARMLDQYASGLTMLSEALGARLRRPADDIAVRTLAGAVVGVGLAAVLAAEDGEQDFVAVLDAHLAQLEAGFDV